MYKVEHLRTKVERQNQNPYYLGLNGNLAPFEIRSKLTFILLGLLSTESNYFLL